MNSTRSQPTRSHPTRSHPTLGDLLDLAQQMQADHDASAAALRHRDRRIGQELVDLRDRPSAQLIGWLDRLRELADDLRGDRVDVLHRLGLLILSLAGLLAGWGAAAVVFRYDGSHPVNVIHVLAVFVFLQLVTLILFGLGLLPPAVTRFLPGLSTVQDALRTFSPGRLQHWLARYLPQRYRETSATILGKGMARQRLYGRVDRWLIADSSQTFAVMFNVGALASCLYLVTFSDLAFSWSTTLQLDAGALARWTNALSLPWASFFPDARPSLDLIESTRYFRFKEGAFPGVTTPAGLGGWWPFLVMCMVTYGLLPRLLTWFLAHRRLRSALNQTFLHYPGVPDLLVRLNTELVETRADQPELTGDPDDPAVAATAAATSMSGQPALLIDWAATAPADAPRNQAVAMAAVEARDWFEAGGLRTPEQDQAVVAAIAGDADLSVIILTKAWEPPMAEFLDFVRALRAASSPDRSLIVVPLGQTADGALTAAEPEHLEVWRSMLARTGDPWLRVLAPEGDAS